MRARTLLTMLMLVMITMSGCFGSDEAEHTDDCADAEDHDACHGQEPDNGNGMEHHNGNETHNETPNMPPVAMIQMAKADGTPLNDTGAIMVGEQIFFSFNGSMDPDGTLDLAALTVIDDNETRTVNVMPDQTVNMTFDVDGPITAVLRLLDDEGASSLAAATTYVNLKQRISSSGVNGADPGHVISANDCEGPQQGSSGDTLLDQEFAVAIPFATRNNTRWIEATAVTGSVDIAICSPDRTALSDEGTSVSTGEIDIAPGVSYYVFAVVRSPSSSPSGTTVEVDVIVHWEPKA